MDSLRQTKPTGELAAIFAALEKINHRLDKLEKRSFNEPIVGPAQHPSLQKFDITEATTGTKEKTCAFEPNGRPCDHCAMCGSRGF